MQKEIKASVVVRPGRRITLPKEICVELGIQPGDVLEFTVKDRTLTAKPRKKLALEALGEIRRAFARSGVTEQELQEAGKQVRREIAGSLNEYARNVKPGTSFDEVKDRAWEQAARDKTGRR